METDFLASTNDFLYIFFSGIPAGENFFFYLVETYFLMRFSFRLLEKDFSLMETVTLFESFFPTSGNRHCYEWRQMFRQDLFLN